MDQETDVYNERSWLEQEIVVKGEVHGRTHIHAMPRHGLWYARRPRGDLEANCQGPREAKIASRL
jgi:hypothetical protein